MTLRRTLQYCLALIVLQGMTLWAMGRVAICKCGYVKLWENSIWSSGNSQHVADWYTLGHVNHGLLFMGVFWLVARRSSVNLRLLLTGISGFLWEVIENTEMVLNRFRSVTISLDYYGDSVLNSVFDSIFMICGALLATLVPVWVSVALFFGLEVLSSAMVRDGLILCAIMVVQPIESIKAWQLLGR